ncbi:DUF2332 family protein [Rhodobacter ferrooxidans]|uniref:Uncharacterized protein n=1 Tax=Rhodobacter ferrooxidans TaxID=371731 RepID=C8RW93_9RHOB|nr:DUF2332 family protein [Rhodobacter sp. SW2]EEW26836.1 conserved hypothetical protein [Rhodobacter sp. SW2]
MSAAAVLDSFRAQAMACENHGSPFAARLLRLLTNHLAPGTPLSDHILGSPGDPTTRGDALALRLAAGLHALVLLQRDADWSPPRPRQKPTSGPPCRPHFCTNRPSCWTG